MKVLLKQNVKDLGQAGDIKDVHDGYARNFLLPRKLAIPAVSSEAEKLAQEFQSKKESKIQKEKEGESKFLSLNAKRIEIRSRANQLGHLFKAFHEKDIALELKKRFDLEINPKFIKIPNEIKSLGEYRIGIEKGQNKIEIILSIVPQ